MCMCLWQILCSLLMHFCAVNIQCLEKLSLKQICQSSYFWIFSSEKWFQVSVHMVVDRQVRRQVAAHAADPHLSTSLIQSKGRAKAHAAWHSSVAGADGTMLKSTTNCLRDSSSGFLLSVYYLSVSIIICVEIVWRQLINHDSSRRRSMATRDCQLPQKSRQADRPTQR